MVGSRSDRTSTLTLHKDRLIHFHIHDGTEKPPKKHLALGDGEIDPIEIKSDHVTEEIICLNWP